MIIPTYLPYFVLTGTAATLIAILYGLNRALADADWPTPDRTRTLLVSAVILMVGSPRRSCSVQWASTTSTRAKFPQFNTASCCRF